MGFFYVVGSAPLQQSGFCQQIVLFVSNMRQLLVGAGMQSEFGNFFLLYVQIQRFKPSKFEAAVECLAAEMQSSVHWGGGGSLLATIQDCTSLKAVDDNCTDKTVSNEYKFGCHWPRNFIPLKAYQVVYVVVWCLMQTRGPCMEPCGTPIVNKALDKKNLPCKYTD